MWRQADVLLSWWLILCEEGVKDFSLFLLLHCQVIISRKGNSLYSWLMINNPNLEGSWFLLSAPFTRRYIPEGGSRRDSLRCDNIDLCGWFRMRKFAGRWCGSQGCIVGLPQETFVGITAEHALWQVTLTLRWLRCLHFTRVLPVLHYPAAVICSVAVITVNLTCTNHSSSYASTQLFNREISGWSLTTELR